MKKLLLTIIYPFWYFFSVTPMGKLIMALFIFGTVYFLFMIFFPERMRKDEGMAVVVGFLTMVTIMPNILFWVSIDEYLAKYYNQIGYKTEK